MLQIDKLKQKVLESLVGETVIISYWSPWSIGYIRTKTKELTLQKLGHSYAVGQPVIVNFRPPEVLEIKIHNCQTPVIKLRWESIFWDPTWDN